VISNRPAPALCSGYILLLRKQFPEAGLFYLMAVILYMIYLSGIKPQDFLAACDGIGVMKRHVIKVDLEKLEKILPGISRQSSFSSKPLFWRFRPSDSATDREWKGVSILPSGSSFPRNRRAKFISRIKEADGLFLIPVITPTIHL